ncbi:MAG: TetR/AcrR family transcriptional regulator [Vampirovibrionia bacterium]
MIELTKRQKEIIEVTIKLIAEKGIQNLTIKNISEKMNISEPAIYRHFNSKQTILITLLDTFEANFNQIIENINAQNNSNIKKLEQFYLQRCEKIAQNPDIAKVIFSEEIFQNEKELSDKVHSIMRKNQEAISKIIANAQKENEIRIDISQQHLSMIILGSLRLLITRWRLTDHSFDLVDESKNVWNSLLKMIKTEV